jgi:hypothetical protein
MGVRVTSPSTRTIDAELPDAFADAEFMSHKTVGGEVVESA